MASPARDELEQLAAIAVSNRRVLAGAVAVITVMFGGALALDSVSNRTLEMYQGLVIVACLAIATAMARMAMRLRTPPEAFPSLRVLRDRPEQVAFVVAINRGNPFIALTDREGRLLAKPLRLKGTMVMSAANIQGDIDEERGQANAATALVVARCPHAQARTISDQVGLSSLASLARKAVARAQT